MTWNAAVTVSASARASATTTCSRILILSVDADEIVVLLGASGSGKDNDPADHRRPRNAGLRHGRAAWKRRYELPARERGTGVIFQSYRAFPKMTVAENIGLRPQDPSQQARIFARRSSTLLELVHLEEHRDKYPSQLSGGQQQRSRSPAHLPTNLRCLLFDEPFGALDAQIRHGCERIRTRTRSTNPTPVMWPSPAKSSSRIARRCGVQRMPRARSSSRASLIASGPRAQFMAESVIRSGPRYEWTGSGCDVCSC